MCVCLVAGLAHVSCGDTGCIDCWFVELIQPIPDLEIPTSGSLTGIILVPGHTGAITVGPRISSNKRSKLVGIDMLEPLDRPNGAGIDSGARINLFGMVLDGFRADCGTFGAFTTEK